MSNRFVTAIPVGAKASCAAQTESQAGGTQGTARVTNALAGGAAIVLVCAGVSLAMQIGLPGVFAFSLFLMAWMFMLAIAALALIL